MKIRLRELQTRTTKQLQHEQCRENHGFRFEQQCPVWEVQRKVRRGSCFGASEIVKNKYHY